MASASKQNPSSSKPPRHPFSVASSIPTKPIAAEESEFRNPSTSVSPSTSNSPISMAVEDRILGRSTHLTRPELLRRRSHNLKQLAKCYRDHYWALMEDLKAQHREYYWKYGVSPFKEDNHNQQNKRRKIDGDEVAVEGSGDNDNSNGVKSDSSLKGNCVACGNGCKSKAMPLTNYCQLHILSDKKQKLYTSCTFVNKRAQTKAITCPKPTLASTVPALCNVHFQKAQKDVARALKDAGHNVSSTNKPPPKLHDIIAAFVHYIQGKRRDPRRESKLRSAVKEEIAG